MDIISTEEHVLFAIPPVNLVEQLPLPVLPVQLVNTLLQTLVMLVPIPYVKFAIIVELVLLVLTVTS